MKKSEKLFLAINEIDGDIVEEAKPEEKKPIQMKPEPRSPMKGIIALAACVAVMAVGIFAIVKFKLGGEPDPIQNTARTVPSQAILPNRTANIPQKILIFRRYCLMLFLSSMK